MNPETKLDVLGGFSHRFGHNQPRGTGHVANNLRYRPRETDGRVVKHKTPTTAAALRMLIKAEQDGLVIDVGSGKDHRKTWRDLSASDAKERYWILTDSALALLDGPK